MILDDYYDLCSKVLEKDFREELMGTFAMEKNNLEGMGTVFGIPIEEVELKTKQEVLDFIALLRRLHPDVEYAGQNGKCFIVSKLLRSKFGGEIWYDAPGHITTKIDGVHYDITGEVSPDPSAYPLTDELVLARAEEWDKDWRDNRKSLFLANEIFVPKPSQELQGG